MTYILFVLCGFRHVRIVLGALPPIILTNSVKTHSNVSSFSSLTKTPTRMILWKWLFTPTNRSNGILYRRQCVCAKASVLSAHMLKTVSGCAAHDAQLRTNRCPLNGAILLVQGIPVGTIWCSPPQLFPTKSYSNKHHGSSLMNRKSKRINTF